MQLEELATLQAKMIFYKEKGDTVNFKKYYDEYVKKFEDITGKKFEDEIIRIKKEKELREVEDEERDN